MFASTPTGLVLPYLAFSGSLHPSQCRRTAKADHANSFSGYLFSGLKNGDDCSAPDTFGFAAVPVNDANQIDPRIQRHLTPAVYAPQRLSSARNISQPRIPAGDQPHGPSPDANTSTPYRTPLHRVSAPAFEVHLRAVFQGLKSTRVDSCGTQGSSGDRHILRSGVQ